jgi:hypothetical protein
MLLQMSQEDGQSDEESPSQSNFQTVNEDENISYEEIDSQ